jgi:hypothetical protein
MWWLTSSFVLLCDYPDCSNSELGDGRVEEEEEFLAFLRVGGLAL